MTITYLLNGAGGADSNCTPALGNNEKALATRTNTTNISRSVPPDAADELSLSWTTEPNNPGGMDWPNGSYTGSLEIASMGADISIKIQLLRRTSACGTGETIGTSGSLSGTGVKSYSTTVDPSAGASGDRYQMRVLGSNAHMHSAGSFIVTINDPDSNCSVPITVAVWDQDSYRGRNDDNNEASATWKAAANLTWTQITDANLRVRFLVQETAGANHSPILALQLQYKLNAGAWTNVTASSSVVKALNSTWLTHGADTTQQVGGGTFVANNNWVEDVDGTTNASGAVGVNNEAEAEFCIQLVGADITEGDTIQLRVVDESGDTPFAAYTNTPSLVISATWDQDSYRGRNDDNNEASATWKAAANTDWLQAVDTKFRVRFLVQETSGAGHSPTLTLQLQYRLNGVGGSWTNVTASSSVVKAIDSTWLSHGMDTTQQVGGGSFVTNNNWVEDVDGTTDASGAFGASYEAEAEFCLQIVGADVDDGDMVELRVVNESGDTALDAYTKTPEIGVPISISALSECGRPAQNYHLGPFGT